MRIRNSFQSEEAKPPTELEVEHGRLRRMAAAYSLSLQAALGRTPGTGGNPGKNPARRPRLASRTSDQP